MHTMCFGLRTEATRVVVVRLSKLIFQTTKNLGKVVITALFREALWIVIRPRQFVPAKIGCRDVSEPTLKKNWQKNSTIPGHRLKLKRTSHVCVSCINSSFSLRCGDHVDFVVVVLPKMSAPVVSIMPGCRCGCEILFPSSARTPRFTTVLRLALTASTRFTLSECCEKWSG